MPRGKGKGRGLIRTTILRASGSCKACGRSEAPKKEPPGNLVSCLDGKGHWSFKFGLIAG